MDRDPKMNFDQKIDFDKKKIILTQKLMNFEQINFDPKMDFSQLCL